MMPLYAGNGMEIAPPFLIISVALEKPLKTRGFFILD
jgi:hypothetical protein